MDRQKAKDIREFIETNISFTELEEKFGVKVTLKSGNYTNSNLAMKIEFADIGENGEVNTREAEDFKARAELYGLKPEDLGREFSNGNDTFKITGLKPRSRKFPILAVNTKNGKVYKLAAQMVKLMLSAQEPSDS